MANSLRRKLETDLAVLQARMIGTQNIMREKLKLKLLTLKARGSSEDQIAEYLKTEAGQQEWRAMVNEIKRAAAGNISRGSDFGYMVGFAHGTKRKPA